MCNEDKIMAVMASGATCFAPRPEDVVMGRGKKFRYHPGNMLYADLINDNRRRYFLLSSSPEKKSVVEEIVNRILAQGRFVKRDASGSGWLSVATDQALVKTANAIQYQQRKSAAAQAVASVDYSFPSCCTTLNRSSVNNVPKSPTVVTPPAPKNVKVVPVHTTGPFHAHLIETSRPIRIPCAMNWFSKTKKAMKGDDAPLEPDLMLPTQFQQPRKKGTSGDCSINDDDEGTEDDLWAPIPLLLPILPEQHEVLDVDTDVLVSDHDQADYQAFARTVPGIKFSPCHQDGRSVFPATATATAPFNESQATRDTSLGLIRVTSIGSLVSVDEELNENVSMVEMMW